MIHRAHGRRRRCSRGGSQRARRIGRLTLTFLLLTTFAPAAAAQTEFQWWPELDLYWRPTERLRFFGLGRVITKEEQSYRQRMLGLHADHLWGQRAVLRVGYRSVVSIPDSTDQEHRALVEGTINASRWKLHFSNRTRGEWRWIGPDYSWRIRDRVMVQHDIAMPWKKPLTPYLAFEAFYDSRYRAVARERYQVGLSAPIGPIVTIDLSYMRQDESRASFPHVNVLWSKLSLAFGRGG